MTNETVIHPSAIVDAKAQLGQGVVIGPFCIVGPGVSLGDGVVLKSHVVMDTRVTVGNQTTIYPFASFNETQDKKYQGEESWVEVGSHTVIREYVTIQPGTAADRMKTVVGDHCLLMVGTHVAHDCLVGNHVIMANLATLAGHVTLEDYVILGGLAAIHQRVRVGCHAIIGGMSGVEHDVLPYASVKGDRAYLNGLNLIGLKRRGFSREGMETLRRAYDLLFDPASALVMADRVASLKTIFPGDETVMQLVDFLTRDESRSVLTPKAPLSTPQGI